MKLSNKHIFSVFFLIFIIISGHPVFGQIESSLIDEANKLFEKGERIKALDKVNYYLSDLRNPQKFLRAKALILKGKIIYDESLDSATVLKIFDEALLEVQKETAKIPRWLIECEVEYVKGAVHFHQKNFEEAVNIFEELIEDCEYLVEYQPSKYLNTYFVVYERYFKSLSEVGESHRIVYKDDPVKTAKKYGRDSIAAEFMRDIGRAAFDNNGYGNCIKSHQEAIKYFSTNLNTTYQLADSYAMIGVSFEEKEQLDSALVNYEKCLHIAERDSFPYLVFYAARNIGSVYLEQDSLERASYFLEKAKVNSDDANDKEKKLLDDKLTAVLSSINRNKMESTSIQPTPQSLTDKEIENTNSKPPQVSKKNKSNSDPIFAEKQNETIYSDNFVIPRPIVYSACVVLICLILLSFSLFQKLKHKPEPKSDNQIEQPSDNQTKKTEVENNNVSEEVLQTSNVIINEVSEQKENITAIPETQTNIVESNDQIEFEKARRIEKYKDIVCLIRSSNPKGEETRKEEAPANYVRVFLSDGDNFLEKISMSSILKKLPDNQFAYIHQSRIINISYIREINNKFVMLQNDIRLECSRDGRKILMNTLKK